MTRPRRPGHINKQLTAAALLASAILAGAVALAPAQTAAPSAPGAPGAPGTPGEPNLSRFEGIAFPSMQVVLNAPIDGKLASILFEEGDFIREGDLLAKMDDTEQSVVVESARLQNDSQAEISRAKFALDEAVILLEQATETFEKGAASEWEVRRAQLQRDQADADLQIARDRKALAGANLKLEEARLDRLRLLAPFDGEVIERSAEPGATLTQTDPVLAVAALDPLEAHINLPVSVFDRLKIGKVYQLDAGDPVNATLPGKLKHIYRIIDAASETVRCVFTIENPDAKLIAGFPVRLKSLTPIE
jgi:RND family efflux transporter MFP subunit